MAAVLTHGEMLQLLLPLGRESAEMGAPGVELSRRDSTPGRETDDVKSKMHKSASRGTFT
jgi:hypothetical protein